MEIIAKVIIPLYKEGLGVLVHAVRNDTNSRRIQCVLMQEKNIEYTIPSGTIAVFNAIKPDGTKAYNNCTISENRVNISLTTQILAVAGIVECQVELTNGTATLSTFKFYVEVSEKLVSSGEVESRDEFSALTDALLSVDELRRTVLEFDKFFDSNMQDATEQITEAGTTEVNKVNAAGATQVANFDAKVQSAKDVTSALTIATSTANTEKSNLETATNNANDAKTNADTAKKNLDTAVATADSKLTALNTAIGSASTAKTNLDSSVSNANTSRTNLNNTITAAGTSKNELQAVIDNAGTIIEQSKVAGITLDFANKTCTRIAGAEGLTGGADFDKFKMYGDRKRCNVANDGTINCYYGEAGYTEDGSNGQVMVYQPKFYYKVVPLKTDQITDGIGHHLRKANYYVSTKPKTGFKLHPAFYDASGNEVDYIMLSAYEGSIYDVSESAFILDDAQVMDYANDLFCSIAGAKPASGKTKNLTRPNINQMCMNRGTGWYSDNIKATSANQMLMIIEMGMMNMQTAIGQGVVSVADNPNTENNSKVTGGTSALGNGTGQATGTSGQVSVSYRGYENPWGNIWKFIYGVNIWGDGTLGGGVPYYATDFNFEESKRTDNYVSAGFSVSNAIGYVSAIGYAPECDWMFIASECLGNSSVPVGDYQVTTKNLNGYRIARLGSDLDHGAYAGAFCWALDSGVGNRGRTIGGRLVYVPTATA